MKILKWLYVDDDAFSEDGVRDPEKYYPLIGASEVLESLRGMELHKVVDFDSATKWMLENGCPDFMSFDNDLGDRSKEGRHLAEWMVERDMDRPGFIGEGFDFFVHSQNPIGKESIYGLMRGYLRFRESNCRKNQESASSSLGKARPN